MAPPSNLCYGYAQSGTCLYGSQCKFVHIDMDDFTISRSNKYSTKRNRSKKKHTHTSTSTSTSTSTPSSLEAFFARYSEFQYNSSESASSEFYRLCDEFNWGRDDDEREQAHSDFKDALVHQFNNIYGTDVNNFDSWRDLCQIVRISPIPNRLKLCREAVKNTHVNIVDLVDTKTTGEPVKVFTSEVESSEYTKATGRYFPRDSAYAGGLLKYLLRQILHPRPENLYQKAQSKHRRH